MDNFNHMKLSALGRSLSDSCVIPIVLKSSQLPLPLMNVCMPVKVAPGMDGNCPRSDTFCGVFLKYPTNTFDRFLFSRAFWALMPSKDRNAVTESIITAIAASMLSQNSSHTMSTAVFLWLTPEMRTMAMMIIKMLRNKKIPRRIFCLRLILTFQSKVNGIEMTNN